MEMNGHHLGTMTLSYPELTGFGEVKQNPGATRSHGGSLSLLMFLIDR